MTLNFGLFYAGRNWQAKLLMSRGATIDQAIEIRGATMKYPSAVLILSYLMMLMWVVSPALAASDANGDSQSGYNVAQDNNESLFLRAGK